jgi:hypothetical protein
VFQFLHPPCLFINDLAYSLEDAELTATVRNHFLVEKQTAIPPSRIQSAKYFLVGLHSNKLARLKIASLYWRRLTNRDESGFSRPRRAAQKVGNCVVARNDYPVADAPAAAHSYRMEGAHHNLLKASNPKAKSIETGVD